MNKGKEQRSSYPHWFEGKTALVTGATSGIGAEIVRLLVAGKAKVLLCGRNKSAMDLLLNELNEKACFPAEGFLIDLSNKEALGNFTQQILGKYSVDILVNAAGFGYVGDFDTMPPQTIDAMQEVNISAVIALCRALLPGMIKKRGCGILNVGSVVSFFSAPGSGLYSATKYFILGFTDALHQEMLSRGVYVTGVYPGKTHSRFVERATNGQLKAWDQAMSPTDVAQQALQGFCENKIRVVPGLSNKIKILIAALLPVSLRLRKSYSNRPTNKNKE